MSLEETLLGTVLHRAWAGRAHGLDGLLFVANPIEFGELWRESKLVELRSSRVRIASIPHLIAMKRLANRPEDQVDIEALEAILAAREDS